MTALALVAEPAVATPPAVAPTAGTGPVALTRATVPVPVASEATVSVPVASGEVAVRRNARTLHAACAELLPGYAEASREPWRQALLTAGCLDGRPGRPTARRAAPPLIVEDVVQASDVLCALWLARRSGLFSAGSSCGDAVGRRSACDIVPTFAEGVTEARRADVLAVLASNTAWRAHRMARCAA